MAEVGLAHDGSLSQAHAYVDAVARAGADAVKWQCHLGDPVDRWRIKPEWPQDADRQAYWRRTGFTAEQWWSLRTHCDEAGIEFMCSPFSVEAVKLLDPLVPAWKVPSGKVNDLDIVKAMLETAKPIIASCGLTTEEEEHSVAAWADALLFCRSEYPTTPERYGMDPDEIGGWYAGISDHSGTIWPSIAAVALGASIIEVHVCWSKAQGGFDASSSVTVEDLGRLVEGVRFVEKAMRPVDKDVLAKDLKPMRQVFMGEWGNYDPPEGTWD